MDFGTVHPLIPLKRPQNGHNLRNLGNTKGYEEPANLP